MTRGNQRDIDRERAQKRNKDKQPKKKGETWEKTKDNHAEIMREKQKAHEEKKG